MDRRRFLAGSALLLAGLCLALATAAATPWEAAARFARLLLATSLLSWLLLGLASPLLSWLALLTAVLARVVTHRSS